MPQFSEDHGLSLSASGYFDDEVVVGNVLNNRFYCQNSQQPHYKLQQPLYNQLLNEHATRATLQECYNISDPPSQGMQFQRMDQKSTKNIFSNLSQHKDSKQDCQQADDDINVAFESQYHYHHHPLQNHHYHMHDQNNGCQSILKNEKKKNFSKKQDLNNSINNDNVAVHTQIVDNNLVNNFNNNINECLQEMNNHSLPPHHSHLTPHQATVCFSQNNQHDCSAIPTFDLVKSTFAHPNL